MEKENHCIDYVQDDITWRRRYFLQRKASLLGSWQVSRPSTRFPFVDHNSSLPNQSPHHAINSISNTVTKMIELRFLTNTKHTSVSLKKRRSTLFLLRYNHAARAKHICDFRRTKK
jgi:hypothetical protein